VTSAGPRSESSAECSITWADGVLWAIDQLALPGELSWLRMTTVDEIDLTRQ
jgi:hypothetical protein